MLDRGVEAVHRGHREVHREELRPQVVFGRVVVDRHTGLLQGGHQPRQRGADECGIHQQGLGGIADAGPTGLGVEDESLGDVEGGGGMDVDVTVADAGLDGGHRGVAHDRVDQAGTTARDHHVDQPAGLDEMGDAGAVGTRQQLHRIFGQPFAGQRTAQRGDQRGVRVGRRRAAAQQDGVAGFEGEPERVDGHVGPALVDDSDHAERNPLLTQLQSVGQGAAPQHLTDRVRQSGDLA